MHISLFITCFNDTLFPQTGRAMVALLERLGHTVDFPMEQTCCGQMHYNTGYQREAIPLVRHFVDVFSDAEVIVAPSASCVGMVRELYPRAAALANDEQLITRVTEMTPRVFELSEFLVYQLGLEDVGAYYPHRVTYHPTCHSLRVLHVGDAPVRLLKAVRGIDFVELPNSTECCGSVTRYEASWIHVPKSVSPPTTRALCILVAHFRVNVPVCEPSISLKFSRQPSRRG